LKRIIGSKPWLMLDQRAWEKKNGEAIGASRDEMMGSFQSELEDDDDLTPLPRYAGCRTNTAYLGEC
jgi:hypothetical protein